MSEEEERSVQAREHQQEGEVTYLHRESATTLFTLKWLLPSVRVNVRLKRRWASEAFGCEASKDQFPRLRKRSEDVENSQQ